MNGDDLQAQIAKMRDKSLKRSENETKPPKILPKITPKVPVENTPSPSPKTPIGIVTPPPPAPPKTPIGIVTPPPPAPPKTPIGIVTPPPPVTMKPAISATAPDNCLDPETVKYAVLFFPNTSKLLNIPSGHEVFGHWDFGESSGESDRDRPVEDRFRNRGAIVLYDPRDTDTSKANTLNRRTLIAEMMYFFQDSPEADDILGPFSKARQPMIAFQIDQLVDGIKIGAFLEAFEINESFELTKISAGRSPSGKILAIFHYE